MTDLLKKKQAGQQVERATTGAPPKVVNLMDALRRSAQAERGAASGKKRGRKRMAGQTEMLLPIEGRKSSQAVAKKPMRATARKKSAV